MVLAVKATDIVCSWGITECMTGGVCVHHSVIYVLHFTVCSEKDAFEEGEQEIFRELCMLNLNLGDILDSVLWCLSVLIFTIHMYCIHPLFISYIPNHQIHILCIYALEEQTFFITISQGLLHFLCSV